MLTTVACLLFQAGAPSPVTADDWLSDARRQTALAQTIREAHRFQAKSTISRSWGNVLFLTPHARLRAASVRAREKYMQLTLAEVAATWTPTVDITALPSSPEKITSRVVNVEHIVVVTPNGPVQPLSTLPLPKSVSNAYGASVSWTGLSATFPLSVLKEGNTLHVILDHPVDIYNEYGMSIEGKNERAKDDPVTFSEKFLGRLKELPPASPSPSPAPQ